VPAVIGNTILYRNGVPIASRESGKLVLRAELGELEEVDDELRYRSKAAGQSQSQSQVPLPL
jgi:hypothetical protein